MKVLINNCLTVLAVAAIAQAVSSASSSAIIFIFLAIFAAIFAASVVFAGVLAAITVGYTATWVINKSTHCLINTLPAMLFFVGNCSIGAAAVFMLAVSSLPPSHATENAALVITMCIACKCLAFFPATWCINKFITTGVRSLFIILLPIISSWSCGIIKLVWRFVDYKVGAVVTMLALLTLPLYAATDTVLFIMLCIACMCLVAAFAVGFFAAKWCIKKIIAEVVFVVGCSLMFSLVPLSVVIWCITKCFRGIGNVLLVTLASVGRLLKQCTIITISSIRGFACNLAASASAGNPSDDSCYITCPRLLQALEDGQVEGFFTPPPIHVEREAAEDVEFNQVDPFQEEVVNHVAPAIVQKKKRKKKVRRELECTLDGKHWAVSGRSRRSKK